MLTTTFTPHIETFQSHLDITIGGTLPLHSGDHLKVIERGDGTWDLWLEGQPTQYAIDAWRINQLAGTTLVKGA